MLLLACGIAGALSPWSSFSRGLTGGALLGVGLTLAVEEIREAHAEFSLQVELYRMWKQGNQLLETVSERILPPFRNAVHLGTQLLFALTGRRGAGPGQTPEWQSEYLDYAERLGVGDECRRILEQDLGPSEASGSLYTALTGSVGKRVLLGYELGYSLSWMEAGAEGWSEDYDGLHAMSTRFLSQLERLDGFEPFGLDGAFRALLSNNLTIWERGVSPRIGVLLFKHLQIFLRTLGLDEDESAKEIHVLIRDFIAGQIYIDNPLFLERSLSVLASLGIDLEYLRDL